MPLTVRDVIVRNLEELEERDFKKFKNKLNEFPVREPYRNPPRSFLEKADPDEVADKIIAMYEPTYGITVTTEVLRDISQHKVATRIEQDLQKVPNFQMPSTGNEAAGKMDTKLAESNKAESAGEPFMDRHRSALIERMGLVDPVLDDLLSEKLISNEQYETVRKEATSQSKMRELYSYAVSWGPEDKETFYQILKTRNEPLVRHLESSGTR